MACGCKGGKNIALQLIKIIQHDRETYSFEFQPLEAVQWKEGDSSKVFLQVKDQIVGKKFSYATIQDEDKIRFTTRIRKQASLYKESWRSLEVGDRIEVSTPSGDFDLKREDRPVLILSNGVGIAAARGLIYAYIKDTDSIPLMASINVNSSSRLYEEEFKPHIEMMSTLRMTYAEDREQYYQSLDYILQQMMMYVSDDPIIYVVGSQSFVNGTIQHLINMGMGYRDIITDGHHNSSGCGCGDESGCGCGGQTVDGYDGYQLPIANVSS